MYVCTSADISHALQKNFARQNETLALTHFRRLSAELQTPKSFLTITTYVK
jgi:hypothetical protein